MSGKRSDPGLAAIQEFVRHFHNKTLRKPRKRFKGPLPRCRCETFNKVADRASYEKSLKVDTRNDQNWFDRHWPACHVFRRVTELECAAFNLNRSDLVHVELRKDGSHLRLFMAGDGIDLSNVACFGPFGNPIPKRAAKACPPVHSTAGGYLISTGAQ